MASLYELRDMYLELFEVATNDTDDGEVDENWVKALDALDSDIDAKLEGCVRVYQSINAYAETLSNEAARLKARADSAENRAKALKDYMKENVEAVHEPIEDKNGNPVPIKRCVGPFVLSIVNNSQPSVEIVNIDEVPEIYDKKRVREIDKKLVVDSYTMNIEVPGCVVKRGNHLRIK